MAVGSMGGGGAAASFGAADGEGSVARSASIIAPLQLRGKKSKDLDSDHFRLQMFSEWFLSLLRHFNMREKRQKNHLTMVLSLSSSSSSPASCGATSGFPPPLRRDTLASF